MLMLSEGPLYIKCKHCLKPGYSCSLYLYLVVSVDSYVGSGHYFLQHTLFHTYNAMVATMVVSLYYIVSKSHLHLSL